MVTARQDAPTLESHWVITQTNLTPASIKTQYESNLDTNAFTDSQVTDVSNNVTHAASNTNPHSTDVGNLGSGTLAELNTVITDATLDGAGDSRPPDAHSIASHSDTTATGAELETLTDGSNADALHTHASGGAHDIGGAQHNADTLANLNTKISDATLDDVSASRTPSAHTIASHSDTTATGAELDTLTDGSIADGLHSHTAGAIPNNEVSSSAASVIVGTQVITGMTITPGLGTYLAIFSGLASNSANAGTYSYRLRANGVNVTDSERPRTNGGNQWSGVDISQHTQAIVTVAAGQAIDVEATDGTGTTTFNERSLILLQLS